MSAPLVHSQIAPKAMIGKASTVFQCQPNPIMDATAIGARKVNIELAMFSSEAV
jgi:hypothetical protein